MRKGILLSSWVVLSSFRVTKCHSTVLRERVSFQNLGQNAKFRGSKFNLDAMTQDLRQCTKSPTKSLNVRMGDDANNNTENSGGHMEKDNFY